jgi:DNA-binding Lrp family transcriptional regulator
VCYNRGLPAPIARWRMPGAEVGPERGRFLVTAVVLIRAERQRLQETAEALLDVDEVKEVYSVAGEYDLVAIVRVRHYDQMAEVVPGRLARLDGITRTTTLMAFQCFSRRDLERTWGIGLEEGQGVSGES